MSRTNYGIKSSPAGKISKKSRRSFSPNADLVYFAFNKPYGVLSQFTDSEGRRTLGDYYNFPPDVYPIGRLDYDSEGLLLLTNDKKMSDFLLNPLNRHEREYFAQVERVPDSEALTKLESGLLISNRMTQPAKAKIIHDPGFLDRDPPIRFRKDIPTAWISLTLTEGRNRQVRKMTAAAGYPTLRLVRVRIEKMTIEGINPGEVKEISAGDFILSK